MTDRSRPETLAKTAVGMSRREFLVTTSALTFAATGFAGFNKAFAANLDRDARVNAVLNLLAAKPVDSTLAFRAGAALKATDPSFPDAFAALADFIENNGISDADALAKDSGFTPALQATAQKLLKAVYLGYAGEPKAHVAEDGVRFVTFSEGLAYQLTEPHVPIPSYSRWGSGYWAELADATSANEQ